VSWVLAFSPEELTAIRLSLRVAFWAMLGSLPVGIAVALLLSRGQFWGKSLLNVIVHLPLVIPPVVTGYILLLLFGRRGLIGEFLADRLGIVFAFRWTGAALACAVMGFPLLVRSIRLSLDAIDRRLEDAAGTLGANAMWIFVTITLPLILPGILAGMILSFARALGEFGATITFVSNIPGETQTLPTAIYMLIQVPGGDLAALRLTLVSIAISMLALFASEALIGRATRLAQFFSTGQKKYDALVRFGWATDTYDREGTPLSAAGEPQFTREELEQALAAFRGIFLQTPPPYSAKKIAGTPAYKLARKQIAVELEPVEVQVFALDVLEFTGSTARISVVCSAGTYLRGIAHEVGSIEVGKLADLVLWKPAFFGVKPEVVIKGGFIAGAMMGDGNASIPTPQPVIARLMFGAHGAALAAGSVHFVSQAGLDAGALAGLARPCAAVRGCRSLRKRDLVLNDALPRMEVDPETYQVRADGELLVCDPADVLPLAQRYFLF